jgi:hypothetical protein
MRYRSKTELLQDIAVQYDALRNLLQSIPASRYTEAGVWGDGWSVGDLVAHLAEWHGMLLRWFREGQQGETPEMPAPGYKWNETPRLNRDIWAKHRGRPFAAVDAEFTSSYDDIIRLLEDLSEAELLETGQFRWTGRNSLVTYVGPNTASHYRFAQKVLKRWLKSS